ncbi:TonB-linked SusC/RagA family outer membrane protein [Arcticibacter tournemirensis]|uniref:SusC/RagA family TonB-linked outer membrane protein n=2 Tax=Arcticibacter tournemirensis TaxID=699437 RepID=A0A5M9GQ03_9SPHI|nr:SusC/RagA family TonB-linked outer membrane protein [Arcticibacter tournemirensis]TQM52502.1 TonB-linked SusC/RagA family outer membrane protein [Arcticibacter tournemirensis]
MHLYAILTGMPKLWLPPKLLLVMKITTLLLLAFVMSVSAGSFAQKINLNKQNAPLKAIFSEIKKQSGYDFIYDEDLIKRSGTVSLHLQDVNLFEALDRCFENRDLMYVISDRIVVVKEKKRAFTLTGFVTDEKKAPLPGVVVINVTKDKSVAADENGRFTIAADKGDIIRFRMIGFEEKVIIANDAQNNITVILKEAPVQLQTTVVTALGIKREERSLGYSVSEIDGEALVKARETNVINSLAGTTPGLIINSTASGPTGSSRVIIRGNTTVTGNNQPLYVVDGIPIDNSNYGGTGSGMYAQGYDFGDAISAINPDDIDKISVLKGPSASALYGARAANGVILITTKKAQGGKDLGIEVNSTTTFENQLTSFDGYQYQYGQGRNQTINTSADQARTSMFNNFGARLDPDLMVISYDGVYRPYQKVEDNIGGFFRTGTTTTNTVSLSSATEKSSFRFSASDLRNSDIIPESGLRRNSFTFNGTSKFGSKISLEARAFYMNEDVDNRPALADDPGNIGNAFIGLANNVDQAWFAKTYKNPDGSYIEWGGGQYRLNPYWVINEMKNETTKNRLLGAFQLNYAVTKWLNFQGRASTDLTYIEFEKFSPRTTPGFITGALDQINRKHVTTEADVLVTAEKQVSPSLYLAARLGGSISRVHNKADNMQFTNLTVPDAISPTSFTDKNIIPVPYRKHLNSVYGLFSAGYKSYLYLDGTIRQDSYSTLSKSYVYPSLSSSFVFSDAFKLSKNILTMGKVRAAISEVASDTDPYLLNLYYNVNPFSFNGISYGGLSTDVMANANLRPTRTRSWEVGTELKFFNNRLGADITYYSQRSRDQINRVPLPLSSGFSAQTINAGVVTNKGVEVLLTGGLIAKKDFHWDVSINFARNINKVESLAEGVPFLTLSEARWMSVAVIAKPGEDYGSILAFGYQKDPDGNLILDPTTLLPLQSEERQVVGKGIFNWTGGVSNTIYFKNFRLSALIDVKQGADLFSMTNLFAANRGSLNTTLEGRAEWIESEELRQAGGYTAQQWAAMGNVRGLVPKGVVKNANGEYIPNTKAVDPSVYWSQILASGGVAIPYIYDGSYVKMREITLGYTIPSKVTARWGVKDVQIALVSRNPFIIYKDVPNVDPDSNYNNGNGQGLEYGSLPTRRSWGVNVNFKF